MEKINLPSGYLSWSQIWLWENDKNEYIRTYIQGGEKQPANALMQYGKEFENNLEQNQFKLECEIQGVKLLGYADYYDKDKNYLQEHKTGLSRWTQEKVNNHGQLKMYAIMIKEMFGSYPTIELLSFNHGEIPDTFLFELNEKKLENFKNKIVKIALEISKINDNR